MESVARDKECSGCGARVESGMSGSPVKIELDCDKWTIAFFEMDRIQKLNISEVNKIKDEKTGLVNTDNIMWNLLIKHEIEKRKEYHPFIRGYLREEIEYNVSF